MHASVLALIILLGLMGALTVVNTNRISELRGQCKGRAAATAVSSESLVMLTPGGGVVPKTAYFVTLMLPAATQTPTATSSSATATPVGIPPETLCISTAAGTDHGLLNSDITNSRVRYLYRADARTLYKISAPANIRTANDTMSFEATPLERGAPPFLSTGELLANNSGKGLEVTLIGLPRYNNV
jgi:hypothetical protein